MGWNPDAYAVLKRKRALTGPLIFVALQQQGEKLVKTAEVGLSLQGP